MARSIRTEGLVDAERLRETLHHLREAGEKGITKAQLARKLGGVATQSTRQGVFPAFTMRCGATGLK